MFVEPDGAQHPLKVDHTAIIKQQSLKIEHAARDLTSYL
jgi:hypothetical protein